MPYWDDGSGQSKSQYDSSGGYDNTGNQNNNNRVDPSLQEAVKKQAKIDKDKKDKKEARDAGFRTTGSQVYSPPTFAQSLKNKFTQNSLNRNKVLAMRKMSLMKKGLPGLYGNIISGMTGVVPDWAQNMSVEELEALAGDIQGIKDYNQATYNKDLNPTNKTGGLNLLGRVDEGQTLLDKGLMTQTEYERLFPGNIQTTREGNDNILPQYAMMGGGADLGGEDAVEDEYDYHLGLGGQKVGRDVTLGYLAKGGRARKAEGGIMELRARRAFGGIMDRVTGRKAYGLGSIFKSVKKAVGKVLKSDIGKAAVLYAGGSYLGGAKMFGGTGNLSFMERLASPSNFKNLFMNSDKGIFSRAKNLKEGYDDGFGFGKLGKAATWAGIGLGASMIPGLNKPKPNEDSYADRGGHLIDPITGQEALPSEMRASLNNALDNADGDPIRIKQINDAYAFLGPDERLGTYSPYRTYGVKDGGRIGKAEGGLMDLGGMEKDYRAEGGFVPIGEYEKKDDVPARLSVNEFVFTADAVRGAGGGDIDKGAEIMENMMVNLEKGGTVSEESQGNAGAQQMFDTSERLGEVI